MGIEEALDAVLKELKDDSIIHPSIEFSKGIPTMEVGVYRPLTNLLKARFEKIGAWEDATHGDWLDQNEMVLLWNVPGDNDRIKEIASRVVAAIRSWDNDAGRLFKPGQISVFAASRYTFERIYLVWLDDVDEPQVWVYDSNGEARYKDLLSYLIAYLEEDLSAYIN